MLSVDDLKLALPRNLQGNATQELADRINMMSVDPEEARMVRENFVTYSSVLIEGKYKTEDYLNAITYCTFKFMGLTNKAAYTKTFPERYTALVARGADDKAISAYVAAYHKNQLVNRILEQSFIPTWLLNQDAFQKAINTQVELMTTAESEMVRTTAANSLLVALKQPEIKKIQLDVGLKSNSGLDALRESVADLVQAQKDLISGGMTAKTVSRMSVGPREEIIDVVPERVTYEPAKQPASIAALGDALQHGMISETLTAPTEVVEIQTPRAAAQPRPSLFGDPMPVPKKPEDIKSNTTNFAQCCDQAIEDCMCAEPDHIHLPAESNIPRLKRTSLFDDPADMP